MGAGFFWERKNPSIVPLNRVGTKVTRPSSSVCPSTVTEIPEWKMAEYLDVLTYFSTDTPLNSKKDNSSKSTISPFTRTSTNPRPFKWIYVNVTEEEWMSSHNALRFKVIYQEFRDFIIQLRHLSKTEQHGGVRERKYTVRNSQLSRTWRKRRDGWIVSKFFKNLRFWHWQVCPWVILQGIFVCYWLRLSDIFLVLAFYDSILVLRRK